MDATLWAHLFDLQLPVLEKVVRPVLVYAFLVLGLNDAARTRGVARPAVTKCQSLRRLLDLGRHPCSRTAS